MSDVKENVVYKVSGVVSESVIVINAGKNKGIKDGNRFIIYRNGNNIVDPDTGEDLGVLEIVVGNGIVKHVQDKICTVHGYKRVLKKHRTAPFWSAVEVALQRGTTEEIEEVEVPFHRAQVGDLAKLV